MSAQVDIRHMVIVVCPHEWTYDYLTPFKIRPPLIFGRGWPKIRGAEKVHHFGWPKIKGAEIFSKPL